MARGGGIVPKSNKMKKKEKGKRGKGGRKKKRKGKGESDFFVYIWQTFVDNCILT